MPASYASINPDSPLKFAFDDRSEQRLADFINLLNSLQTWLGHFTRRCHLTNSRKEWTSAHCYSGFAEFSMSDVLWSGKMYFLLLRFYFYFTASCWVVRGWRLGEVVDKLVQKFNRVLFTSTTFKIYFEICKQLMSFLTNVSHKTK